VLGIKDADSAEHGGESGNVVIAPVSCPGVNRPAGAPSLSGRAVIRIRPDSNSFRVYGLELIHEEYFCNYELNPIYYGRLDAAGLKITGIGEGGEARVVELSQNRFYVATLFQPQLSSESGAPHPLSVAFLDAVRR
jgi:CTP synthase (UTP-ammonia lyase)